MPELDGVGLYQALEREGARIPDRFIFVTGDVLSADTRALIERTGLPTLGKPFTVDQVRRAVRQGLLRRVTA
jgi:CheY-like chemotaxis protein